MGLFMCLWCEQLAPAAWAAWAAWWAVAQAAGRGQVCWCYAGAAAPSARINLPGDFEPNQEGEPAALRGRVVLFSPSY